jgi:hypothetical protein
MGSGLKKVQKFLVDLEAVARSLSVFPKGPTETENGSKPLVTWTTAGYLTGPA